jgi:hypothetical protein
VTLSFIDERQFLTVIQCVLPLHECADLAPIESAAEPLNFVAEPLHSVAESAAGAAPTKTSCS